MYFESQYTLNDLFFFNFYLFMREREREAETQEEGEAGSRRGEPDVGLNPRTPGSLPEPKAGGSITEPPRHPVCCVFRHNKVSYLIDCSVA